MTCLDSTMRDVWRVHAGLAGENDLVSCGAPNIVHIEKSCLFLQQKLFQEVFKGCEIVECPEFAGKHILKSPTSQRFVSISG